jgi:probable HAF family extracellular repeat protein
MDNEFAQFDEDVYLGSYGELDTVVPSVEFPTGLEHFKKVGSKSGATKKEGFYTAGAGDDTVTTGKEDADVDIYGVGITAEFTRGTGAAGDVTYKPGSLGIGEKDTLIGRDNPTKEDGFFLSVPNGVYSRNNLNDPTKGNSSRLYVGKGNKDFARIKNFNVEYDYVSLSGGAKDYIYRYEKDSLAPGGYSMRIYSKVEKDLLGIVEGIKDIQPRRFLKDGTFRLSGRVVDRGFNDNVYNLLNGVTGGLEHYVTNGQFWGKSGVFSGAVKGSPVSNSSTPADGNDTLVGIGKKTLLSGVELSVEAGEIKAGTGTGQKDTLVGSLDGEDEFLLGFAPKAGAAQAFYLGTGASDFATIQNYENRDRVVLAGGVQDYVFKANGANLEILKNGDLIGVVEGVNALDKTAIIGDGKTFTATFTNTANNLNYTQAEGTKPTRTGAGNDTIDGDDKDNKIFASDGINTIRSGAGRDTVFTGKGNDFIDAGDGADTVSAGAGKNSIIAGGGHDKVVVGSGDNTIYSGTGDDKIFLGNGNNIINAGTGKDLIDLGTGANRIILEAGKGDVAIIGFDITKDKLRLGESLEGKTLQFVRKGKDTLVVAGDDTLAILKNVKGASDKIVDSAPLYNYEATDLGSPSTNINGAINAVSINDFGQIALRYDTGENYTNQNATTGATQTNPIRRAAIWQNGTLLDLPSTGIKNGQSDLGAPTGSSVLLFSPNINTISNRAILLGTADEVRQPVPKATDRALLWEKDTTGNYKLTINDFGGLESYFFDINNTNQIVGRNILTNGYEKTIYSEKDGTVKELTAFGGDGGTARGINNKGQIVGFVDSDGALNGTFVDTAVLWEKDAKGVYQLKNLGTFGGQQATLRDINDAGHIIGSSSSGSGTTLTSIPFVLRDGKYTALGSLGGKTGSVSSINEFGQIVGSSADKDGKNRAFMWMDGKMLDLNNLLTKPLSYNGAAVTLTNAVSINNFGDITALGTYTYKNAAGVDQTGTRSFSLKGIANNNITGAKSSTMSISTDKLAKIVSGKGFDKFSKGKSITSNQARNEAKQIAEMIASGGISDSIGHKNIDPLLGKVDLIFGNTDHLQQMFSGSDSSYAI